MKINTIIALLPLVSFCTNGNAQMKEILRVKLHVDSLILQAQTTGCTKKEDFSISLTENKTLRIKRIKNDMCRMRAREISFRYEFEELGLPQPSEIWIDTETFK